MLDSIISHLVLLNAEMGESKPSSLLSILVFIIDLIAFGLAVAAEINRNTVPVPVNVNNEYLYCAYGSDMATDYAVGACIFLLLSHTLLMGVTRHVTLWSYGSTFGPRQGTSHALAILLFVASWVSFVVAEVFLIAGAWENANLPTKYQLDKTTYLCCQQVAKGVFATGAAFTAVKLIVSEGYYISFVKANDQDERSPFLVSGLVVHNSNDGEYVVDFHS